VDECIGCGAEIPRRGNLVRYYCSNRCQRDLERRENLAWWLMTGEATICSRLDHYVRAHVLEEQRGRCALCGLSDEWNGAELRFVLDHVDGDSSNNRRENLRLVCPNCDSQLPTYKNRNKGRGRHARRVRYANGQSY
jgi:endogenous inhibitor of DNA gyrase (YacG/DUF329 family)